MHNLGIASLKNELIGQCEHMFGHSNKPVPMLCAVCVPFKCKTGTDGQNVESSVRFDFIERDLLFLIGLLAILAMKGNLNIRYNNPSIVKHQTVYRLQWVRQSTYLELPLVCYVTYQRALRVKAVYIKTSRDH